jgi:hypothetical protein
MEYTIYDSCIQFDDSQANMKTPKRKKRIITPKIPDFLSPIRAGKTILFNILKHITFNIE